jgi:spore coat polysaccharide biosynthesis protein SpsF (cytidylyltransferase family)
LNEILHIRSAIVIQARMGSSRLPGKVLLPFYGEQTILDIILRTLANSKYKLRVILATSTAKSDDALHDWAIANNLGVFRGHETDVLNRFVEVSDLFELNNVVRVCADNPFLDQELLDHMIGIGISDQCDYCSYMAADDTPAMKSHLGVFAEWVRCSALRKVQSMTRDPLYTEHVTNFIYSNPEHFNLRWLKAPEALYNRKDVRFTIDTPEDFALMQQLFAVLAERGITPNFSNILQLVEHDDHAKQIMQNQIRKISK